MNGGVAQVLPARHPRARPRRLLLEPHDAAAVQHQHLRGVAAAAHVSAAASPATGPASASTGNVQRSELFTNETDSIVNGYAPSMTANLSSKRLGHLPLYVVGQQRAEQHPVHATSGGWCRPTWASSASTRPRRSARRCRTGRSSTSTRRSATATPTSARASTTAACRCRCRSRASTSTSAPISSDRSSARSTRRTTRFADRLKHVIEPNFSIQHITDFENLSRVVTAASSYDYVIPDVDANQLRADQPDSRAQDAGRSARRVTPRARRASWSACQITQSYYTDPQASRYDNSYQSSSYIAVSPGEQLFAGRAHGADGADDAHHRRRCGSSTTIRPGRFSSFSATGNSNYRAAQVAVGWSTRTYSSTVQGERAERVEHARPSRTGRRAARYLMNWDIARGYIIQQRWTGFYNAQCCGLTIEYQQYNFPSDPRFPIPRGSPLQHVVLARRHRHVLELLRRVRRRQRRRY